MTQQEQKPQPLWPQAIEIVGLTGEYASGKSLFGLSIDPKHTLVFDTEKSTGTYLGLGFDRVDIPAEMMKAYPKGYKPVDTFLWWWSYVKALPAGKYRVIGLDTASEIESGLADWVSANPGHFGRTAGQYLKMSGVMWGDVKELWKAILSDLAARCETFYFTTHLTNVWSGDKPLPGKRKAKGKETLMELASLYLHMERKADGQGNVPAKPAATVLKTRLLTTSLAEDGDLRMVPTLPPRLPVATPAAIRAYMTAPPDYSSLKPEERVRETQLSEDDRALLALSTAEAQRDAAAFQMEAGRMESPPTEGQRTERQPPAQPAGNGHPPKDLVADMKAVETWLPLVLAAEQAGSLDALQDVITELNNAPAEAQPHGAAAQVVKRAIVEAKKKIKQVLASQQERPLVSAETQPQGDR